MKILFITYFFAPYNCIGAVRTTRTVEKLIDMGHDVKIISAKDQHLMSNLSTTVSETHIKRTSWFDFEKPIYSILGSNKVSSVKNNTHKGSFTSKLLNIILRINKLNPNRAIFCEKFLYFFLKKSLTVIKNK